MSSGALRPSKLATQFGRRLLQRQHVHQMLGRIIVGGLGDRGDACRHELVHHRGEVLEGLGDFHAVRLEHVLIVEDRDEFAVVRDADERAGTEHAVLVILAERQGGFGDDLVPAAAVVLVVERLQQALRSGETGGAVALVIFEHVRGLGRIEDHGAGLVDLVERLELELHVDTRVRGLEGVERRRPGNAEGAVGRLVPPDLERLGIGRAGGRGSGCQHRGRRPRHQGQLHYLGQRHVLFLRLCFGRAGLMDAIGSERPASGPTLNSPPVAGEHAPPPCSCASDD